MNTLKNYGLLTTAYMALNKFKHRNNSYETYLKKEDTTSQDLPPLISMPKISIIVFGDKDLSETLNSIKAQTNYDSEQIEIIIISNTETNSNVNNIIIDTTCDKNSAYKKAFSLATGEYVAFMDSDTILSETTLYYMVRQLIYNNYDLIYCDEDTLENGIRKNPFFKPSWSPDTLRSFNYIGFALIKKSLINNFTDYYNLLIDLSYKPIKVRNVQRILVHYTNRIFEENTKPSYNITSKISIIIPSKDNYKVLKNCIDSIREKTTYSDYEIIVVDNGSTEETQNLVSKIADKYIYNKTEFNFSQMCNLGAKNSTGEFLLFLNDDTQVISSDWLAKMVYYANLETTGAVGCKLLYPNNTIQHCGVVSSKNGPVHCFLGTNEDTPLYFGRDKYTYNYSALTGACLLIKKDKFIGFDENLPVAYNDIDLCFTLCEKGFYNIVVNDVKLYHYESLSRGNDTKSIEKLKRLYIEREKLYKKHPTFAFRDSFYNRNLNSHRADFTLEYNEYINKSKFNKAFINPDRFYNKINYSIEYFKEDDITEIIGYAYSHSPIEKISIIVFTRHDVAVPIETQREIRQDISFKENKTINLCGFSCNIDTSLFEKSTYQLGLMVTTGLKKQIVVLDKQLNIKL